MAHRIYVDVIAWHKPDGGTEPIKVRIGDDSYSISKVHDVRQAASLKAGGEGIRYICEILVPIDDVHVCSKELLLFNCEQLWFVESDRAEELERAAQGA